MLAMPQRSFKACSHVGCPGLTRDRFCEKHSKEAGQAYDRARGSAAERGYDRNWRKLRRMFLAAHPICEDPYDVHGDQVVAATDVDHVVPLASGGSNVLENLQALCHACHSRKTAKEDHRWV